MFSKLLDKIFQNKRNLLWIIVGISLFFVMSDSVFAETVKTEAQRLEDSKAKVASFVSWLSTVITLFLSLLTYLSTVFLSPEWINGSLFGLNSYFKSIWVLVSNVVYLAFAFILIWIAFMNIIGKGQEKYALKQALPKFIVGVLIVPFSWFFIQFILSISAVLTISALNLPFETFSTFNTKLSTTQIPQNCTLDFKALGKVDNKDKTEAAKVQGFMTCGDKKISLDELRKSDKSVDSIFGVIGIYTYGILSLEGMDKLNKYDVKSVTNMADLVVKLLFDVLFIIIYSILIIAMGLVLMVRGIYIWIYMMIAPIFGLMYFFDKTSGGGEFFDKFNVKQFLSLAFVPVYTMLALSFGLLFIYAAGNGMSYNGDYKDINTVKLSEPKGENGEQTLTVGQFSLEIKGSPSNPKNVTGFFENISNKGMGVIGTLIMKIFGIVVLWGVVMAALRSNEITKAIVEPLHAFGGQVGGLITKAPQYAPIFGGQSMQSMSQIGATASSYYNQKANSKGTDFLGKHGLFGQTAQTESKAANALAELKSLTGDNLNSSAVGRFSEALHSFKNSQEASNSKSMVESAQILASKLNIDKAKYEKISGDKDAFARLISEIDFTLDVKGNLGNVIKDRDKVNNHNEFNGSSLDRYLIEQQQNPTQSPIPQDQNINLNIKADYITSFNDIKTKSSGLENIYNQLDASGYKGSFTKLQFVKKLVAEGIAEKSVAEEIATELNKKDDNFFKKETPKT